MEGNNIKKNNNQISMVLMVVGVIFILISGSIFVTTAWQHLSENTKRVILIAIVAGLYTVSWKLREKGILSKTEHALYYLATAGTGFITVSFLGGWHMINGYFASGSTIGTFNNADRALWGFLAASVGIAYRFIKEKKVWDFGILTFIFINMFALVFEANVDNLAGIIPLTGLVLLATVQYRDTEGTGYRIAQSFGLLLADFYLVYELCVHFAEIINVDSVMWWAYMLLIIPVILMVVLERTELVWSVIVINWFMVLVQFMSGIDDWNSYTHIYELAPFASTTAIAFLIMWLRGKGEHYKNFAIIHGLMVATQLVTFVLAKTGWISSLDWDVLLYAGMGVFLMVAFIPALIDSVLVNDTAKHIMKTLTLLFAELAAFCLAPITAPEDFAVEFISVFFGAGIVVLGKIWYDRANGIRVAQFVLTCLTLFTLLVHNICVEELVNLMFLGVAGIIMLIVAAMNNHKEYVIASSTTLSLLALYITRDFWLSIEWWVYLLVAGIALVAIAIKKEKEA